MYLIDGPIVAPISSDLYYVNTNNSWDTAEWSGDPTFWGFWHAAHVAGVVASMNNNFLLRGINPGQVLSVYGGSTSDSGVMDRFNQITAYSELSYEWGVINISINHGPLAPSANPYEFSNDIGRSMAIASNTNLITQAAGNNNGDACNYGYSFNGSSLAFDGIVVTGGHDLNGARAIDDTVVFNNYGISGPVPGSNSGPCIDLWAPSRQITSLRYNTNLTQVLSGTSFSAPIAGAIASRYGNNQTRPVERESFLRAYAQHTGYYDATSRPILSVKWSTGSTGVLKRYALSGVWSPQNTTNINNLKDGSYQGIWNAMGNTGTVVIDLGQNRNVRLIRVTPRSSIVTIANGIYPIYFSIAPTSSGTSTAPTGAYQGGSTPKHFDRTPISIALDSPINSRYLILNGHNYGSWLAYSEIEVYGY
ncbi:S8 family serine peptidase [Ottowia sp.]|uniref:S8 family serine peptidase n=1 Tax=Ottowia sp. TaxID=1898956 RepID=UPI00262003E3|nr:S8 family serine peptidase [Ottowia sp.]